MLLLLGALLAVTGPNALEADDVCLMRRECNREPVFCLADDPRCAAEPQICLMGECPEPGPRLRRR